MELTGIDEPRMILRALREAADHLGIGLAILHVTTPAPRVIFINEGAARILGRTPAEMEGVSPFDLLAPEVIAEQRARLAARGTGDAPPLVLETVAVRPDGTRVPIEVALTRVVTASATLNVTFVRDISAQQHAVETLRRSEERFRRVVENAPDGVVILQRGRIVFMNDVAVRLLEVTRDAAMGTPITDHILPEDAAIAAERIGRMMQTGETFEPHEYRPKGNPERIVEIKSILVDHEGAPAVLAFARDVSARKRIEQELVRADRLASIGMMSAAVAHEINNPLAYVQLCLQYLARELPGLVTGVARERVLEQVRNASHGIDRVATIVRDLRAFARSDDGELASVDVVACIEQALKLVDNEVRHRARVVRDFADVPHVQASASRLEQVFVNVLVNAAQAIGPGDPEHHEIHISVRARDGVVTIAISDTGPGIAPELRERVFEPFFSTKAVAVGTGLGLAVCRSIIEQFGGTIEIGGGSHGATLTIALPVHRGPTAAPPAIEAVEEDAPPRRRVLVVDDEPLVRRALATVLGTHHDVLLADHGRHALEQLAAHAVDVIVCDVMMPVMNGKELYEHLRARDPALARRFVFITGGSLGSVTGFLEQTGALILYKPFELAKVLELVALAAER